MPMYNFIEHKSKNSDTAGSLWFYSKDEVTNFEADIANTNAFKSFEYKTKLFENTVRDGNNSFLKNALIAVSLKYLSNFWQSLEVPLINCTIELKIRWMKHCVLASAGTENDDANSNNIIFTIKDTKLYFRVVTFSAKDNQKLAKDLKDQFTGMNVKQNVRIKLQQMITDIFSNQILSVLIDCLC